MLFCISRRVAQQGCNNDLIALCLAEGVPDQSTGPEYRTILPLRFQVRFSLGAEWLFSGGDFLCRFFVAKVLCTAGPFFGLLRRFSEQASAAALVQWVVASRFRVLNVLGIRRAACFCIIASLFSFIYLPFLS